MTCRDMTHELVAYCKDELDANEREQVQAHLQECKACRAELAATEATLLALRKELVPIELSAHFRIALMDRVDEATKMQPQAPRPASISSGHRHMREMDPPLLTRLWDHTRRSPYFAASIAVHAIAAVVVIALFLRIDQLQNRETDRAPTPAPVIEAVIAHSSTPPARNRLAEAYGYRRTAPRFATIPASHNGGLAINLTPTLQPDGTVVLAQNNALHCVVAFLTDREGQITSDDVLSRIPTAMRTEVADGRLIVPNAVANNYLAAGQTTQIVSLPDRIEMYSMPSWDRLRAAGGETVSATLLHTPGHLIAAILPPRRREI